MDPQLGAGAGMPRPRNESDASAMIVRATENVATTVMGGSTLGSRWRRRIHPSPAPRARAAATKSRIVRGEVLALRERDFVAAARSEEHTSELQSHSDLVCRL